MMDRLRGPAEWREELRRLFADAGYESGELLRLVDAFEELAADYSVLLAENERLKQEAAARKPRTNAVASHMSSKLWDAIHE